MEKIIVSAPFGNWLSFPSCTSTLGTFTLKHRGGLLYRLWRCLLTLRYNRRQQSWLNRLGLPNPGITSVVNEDCTDKIVSLHGFDTEDWRRLIEHCRFNPSIKTVELNLSCPNVRHRAAVDEMLTTARFAQTRFNTVIAKLPPVKWMDFAAPLWNAGVSHFHCCNTIPTPSGGISGKPLKQYSLWAVSEIKQRWGEAVSVIGGGGVTEPNDVREYLLAGADHVAIGSMLLNPLNWRKVKDIVEEANMPLVHK